MLLPRANPCGTVRHSLAAVVLSSLVSVSASGQVLVGDLNPGPPMAPRDADHSRLLRALATDVVFARATRNEAFELWRSDGTAAGTRLVADLCPGECSGVVDAEVVGSRLFFVGYDAAVGGVRELYVSDGTSTNTLRLPAATGGLRDPLHLRGVNGTLLFAASQTASGRELWRSDGTVAGTVLVRDIYPGSVGSDPVPMLVSNGILYFTALDPTHGREVWRSDGTAAGTYLFAETVPGSGSASEFDQMLEIGGVIYFGADVAPAGYELWRSDGTTAGTRLLKDVHPGAGASYPSHFTELQGQLVFSAYEPTAGRELWVSDGTTAGTRLLVDVAPGSASSNPQAVTRLGNRLIFAATTAALGTEPWESDGTAAGTRVVADLAAGPASSSPSDFVRFGPGLVFSADDGVRGTEAWFTDGTAAGTRLLADAAPGATSSYPSKAVVAGSAAYFFAFDPVFGRELWKSDATGTARVADVELGDEGSYPRVVLALGDETFLAVRSRGADDELWRSDGTSAGTSRVPDPPGGSLGTLASATLTRFFAAALDDAVYFVAAGSIGGNDYPSALWRFDRVAGSTGLAFGQPAGGSFAPSIGAVAAAGAGLLMAVRDATDGARKLMRYAPGIGVGTLVDFGPGSAFDVPAGAAAFTAVGDVVFFQGHTAATGAELWRTDGTASGSRLVRELAPGVGSAGPRWLCAHGGALYFACIGVPGLFRSDGTAAGTGAVGSFDVASPLVSGAGKLLFMADDGTHGVEPWVSDGSAAATTILLDVAPGSASGAAVLAAVWAGDTFFFLARTDATGFELWRSDGTPAGTAMVRDVNPGSAPGAVWTANQDMFLPAPSGSGRLVLFGGATRDHGVEVWRSDGTSAGTTRVGDLRAGPSSSTPRAFATTGRRVLLSADDGARGQELFALDLAAVGGVLAAPFGVGCAGSNGRRPAARALGLPILGASAFALQLSEARAQSTCVLLLGAARARQTLGNGCTLWPQGVLLALTQATDLGGTAVAPLPVPATPVLAGSELFVQFAVADPGAAFSGVAAFSNGVHLLVGR
ncbi:MAG: hypothetical protein R3F56_16535 [Planctomycetota bacterium]